MSDSILPTSLVLSIIYPFLSIFCYPLFIHIIYPLCMIYTKEVGWSDRLLFKKPLSLPLFEKRPIVLPSSSLVLNIYIYFFLSKKKYFILFYIFLFYPFLTIQDLHKLFLNQKIFPSPVFFFYNLSCQREDEVVQFQYCLYFV